MRVRVLIASVCAIATACTGSGDDDAETVDDAQAPVGSVTVPPERLTPFCQKMIDLDESLPADPSIDAGDQILAAYRDALPDVPAEIAVQFTAVIEALEAGTEATLPPTIPSAAAGDDRPAPPSATTTATTIAPAATTPPAPPPTPGGSAPSTFATEGTFDEEGYLPDESPAAQVNAYIDFACRGTVNNPGPPPTEPDAPIVTDPGDG